MIPLLQRPGVNPHATLITLFMNAVDENMTHQDQIASLSPNSPETKRLFKYLPRTNMGMTMNRSAEIVKFTFARDLVTTYDHIFNR